jgi:hypothetical protein
LEPLNNVAIGHRANDPWAVVDVLVTTPALAVAMEPEAAFTFKEASYPQQVALRHALKCAERL